MPCFSETGDLGSVVVSNSVSDGVSSGFGSGKGKISLSFATKSLVSGFCPNSAGEQAITSGSDLPESDILENFLIGTILY